MPGWASPARPAVYKPPVGARVASPQNPILRWSTPRVSALDWATSGLSKSPLLIARPLLLTTNCPLLLTTAVRFCSHRDREMFNKQPIKLTALVDIAGYSLAGQVDSRKSNAGIDRKSTRLN